MNADLALSLAASLAGLAGAAAAWLGRRARPPLGLAVLLLAAAAARRWVALGHPPVFGTYESDLADGAVLLGAIAAVLPRLAPGVAGGGALVGALLPLRGLTRYQAYPLTISERSLWIDLHATLGYATFTLLTLAVAAGARQVRRGEDGADGTFTRLLTWAFFTMTALIATGSFYSSTLFGELWRWDLVEALALGCWLGLGTLIHLRLFYGWEERRLARWLFLLAAFALVLFKGLGYLPRGATYHAFDLSL